MSEIRGGAACQPFSSSSSGILPPKKSRTALTYFSGVSHSWLNVLSVRPAVICESPAIAHYKIGVSKIGIGEGLYYYLKMIKLTLFFEAIVANQRRESRPTLPLPACQVEQLKSSNNNNSPTVLSPANICLNLTVPAIFVSLS